MGNGAPFELICWSSCAEGWRFESGTTQQDYRAAGMACVGVLEALSGVVCDPAAHLGQGEEIPPETRPSSASADSKRHRYLTMLGSAASSTRRSSWQKVKHNPTPTRRHAGVAADSVIMLANLLRRLHERTE
jgi:hypothetical protein